jgi:hypothetical protein
MGDDVSLTIATPPTPDTAPRRLWPSAPLAAILVIVLIAAAGVAWSWTRDPGKHRALPDMCTGVPGGAPSASAGSCAWSANGTSYTVTTKIFQRTRLQGAPELAAAQFRNEREGAINRVADSGYPKAFQEIPDAADEAFCVDQYDGSAYSVTCTARDSNAILDFAAGWNDTTAQPGMRNAVAQALKTYAPTAQHLLTNSLNRL